MEAFSNTRFSRFFKRSLKFAFIPAIKSDSKQLMELSAILDTNSSYRLYNF